MPIRTRIFFACTAAAAAIAAMMLPGGWELSGRDIAGAIVFLGVGVLADALALDVALKNVGKQRTASSSIAFIPLFAAAVIFPPPVSVAATAIVHIITQLLWRQRGLWKAVFNISQVVLGMTLAATTYHAIVGGGPSASLRTVLGFGGLSLVFFGTNLLLVSIALSLLHTRAFLQTVKQAIGPGGGNLLFDVLASPIALVVAVLYKEFFIGGILLVILPLYLIRHAYSTKFQLQQANQDLLKVLVKAIETRDPYTSGHSLRVSTLAKAIAEDMRLPNRVVERVETAALLHDIGKIDVDYASIIRKPSQLTNEEYDLIKTHATKGADLLRSLSSVEDEIILTVKHHHERFDGLGYPDGLVGTAIPLPARIIMLCDSVDAMLSDRPYRRALSMDQVRKELVRCSGDQFDPKIVEVVLRCGTLERAAVLAAPARKEEPEENLVQLA